MQTLGDRLKEALGDAGKKAPWLATQTGRTKSAVYQWLNGETGGMKPENLVAAARALGVRTNWLATGELPKKPLVEAEPVSDLEFSRPPVVGDTQGGPDKFYIEYGYPTGYGDEVVDAPAKNPQTYGLRVRGGSMYPRMREGDVVTLDPEQDPMVGVDVVVRTVDGEVMVKTLAYDRDDEVALDSLTESRRVVRKDQIELMHMVIGIHPPHAVKKRG